MGRSRPRKRLLPGAASRFVFMWILNGSWSPHERVLPLLGQLPGHTIRQRGKTPRTRISRISDPAVIASLAPESSVSKYREGYRGSIDSYTAVVSKRRSTQSKPG